jgi:hypothetical protein
VELTGNDEDDASAGSSMLKGKTGNIRSFHGDGAYDKFGFREVSGHPIGQLIPPPKNAVIQKAKGKKPLPDLLDSAQPGCGVHKQTRFEVPERTKRLSPTKPQ